MNTLTFGLFFKDTQEVTINASDNSGTVFVSYLVTDKGGSLVSAYDEAVFNRPNGEYIVYAMLVDAVRITLDKVRPVLPALRTGKTCETQTVTENILFINGTAVTLDETGSFPLSGGGGDQDHRGQYRVLVLRRL